MSGRNGENMKFKCNNTEYEIKEVDNIELTEGLIGQANYQEKTILLKKLDKDLMIKTLKHELMHVWMFEYGHPQNDNENFTYENVCNMVACSNDFINEVVKEYKQDKEVCHVENKNWNSLSYQEE